MGLYPQEVVLASISTVFSAAGAGKDRVSGEFLLEISGHCRYNKSEVV